jgi:hypothetical protein
MVTAKARTIWPVAFGVRLLGVALGLTFFRAYLEAADTHDVYYAIARSLASGGGYALNGSAADAGSIAPIFPAMLGVLMSATGPDIPLWLVGVSNAAFRAWACVLVYRIADRAFGSRAALCALVLYLIDPWESLWVGFVLKESIAVPLFLFAVWKLMQLEDRRTPLSAAAAGAAIGVATLARFASGALWIAAAVIGLAAVPGRARRAAVLAALTAGLLVVLSPWLIRNALVTGQPVLSTHFVGRYLYSGNVRLQRELSGYAGVNRVDPAVVTAAPGEHPMDLETRLLGIAADRMVHHPVDALTLIVFKAANMWQPTFGASSVRNLLVLGVPYCVLLGVSLVGAWRAWKLRAAPWGLVVPLVLMVAVHLIFWGEIRNRQYLMPMLYGFGGFAVARRSTA